MRLMQALRFVVLPPSLAAAVWLAGAGCNSLLGIDDHRLAVSVDGGVPLPDGAGGNAPGDANDAPTGPPPDGGTDGNPEGGNPGGPVTSILCGDSGICVFGGIDSVARVGDDAGPGRLPGGGIATVVDDGFEFGNTLCDPTGTTCVTGAIVP
jgi:hypothetical protein